MENFIVSARKYRPVTFSSVIGQQSITTTLKNAVKNNKLAQSFLFCGPRGVGKTTCARILAKIINCLDISDDFEPCNKCESCRSFNENASFHIYELDAASNNSVDDIRHLVEQVRIPPQSGKYKVYIIDEVHMLSSSAFNAFLKTLEEPPAYTKFILATTEKHKIIPTILSRCQIFDFKRMYVPDIVAHLQNVATQENITYEDGVLHVIAQKADGAMRDALSIFDQVINYCGNNLEYKKVIENLNVLDYDYYFELIDAFLSGNIPQALLTLNQVIESGFDGQYFIMGLGEHLRNLLICRTPETIGLLEVSEDVKKRYFEQMQGCTPSFLLKALEINNQCDLNYKIVNSKRLLMELSLMKICKLNEATSDTNLDIKPETPKPNPVSATTTPEEPAKTSTSSTPISKSENVSPSPRPFLPTTGVSIKKQEKTEDQKQKEALERQILNTPFTQEQLNAAWTEIAKNTKTEDLRIAFQARMPILTKDNRVVIELDNNFLQEQVKEITESLKLHLSKKLNNNQFSIESVVVAHIETPSVPYSDTEKLQDMTKRNPNLKDFITDLDLQ